VRAVASLTIGLVLTAPQLARAYSEEPLCALRTPDTTSQAESIAQNACVEPQAEKRPPIPWSQPIGAAEARESLRAAALRFAEGRPADALLELRIVAHSRPEVGDRIALRQAEALLQMGTPERACELYERAAASLDRGVAVRGRIGGVRCRLRAGDRDAEAALQELFRRYPNLGERDALRLELAQAREGWGNARGAATLYRSLDQEVPHTAVAAEARVALERLRGQGVALRPWTAAEAVQRGEILVREGTLQMAREALGALDAYNLKGPELAQLHLLRARLARVEGRFDDAAAELARARREGAPTEEAARLQPPAPTVGDAVDQTAREKLQRGLEARIKALIGRRPASKLNNAQLRAVYELALEGELREPLDLALEQMAVRTSLAPALRFDAALRAFGVAGDVRVAELFATLLDVPALRVPARYHHGRALERLGRSGEAEAEYLEVYASDRSETRWYAMWADQRLWLLKSQRSGACVPEPIAGQDPVAAAAELAPPVAPLSDSLVALLETDTPVAPELAMQEAFVDPAPAAGPAERDAIVARLRPFAERHGAAYPWLIRALALVELDLREEAADELNEAYLAFRDASGSPRLRSGLEAVFTGSAPPRRATDFALRHARLALSAAEREELASIAGALGDPGIETHFGRWRANERPRAYAEAVQAAARKYELDPNLLFAVMRVESIYNRRIVSYAGAVGLMQIMPRTGRLIADRLGVENFQVTDLLDPGTNVEFAAWYLASLLRRFDGRLPLAIASYNGGPHNVRLWMRANHPNMPLDAFLERIPFTQTHRYVRRVLTHYAAYRAQQQLPMTRLSVELPQARPDLMAF
jgi:soluble lytic murein transglycosylase